MNKILSRRFCMIAVLALSFSSVAFADVVQGRVASSSPGLLALTVFDAQGRPYPNTLRLKVDNRTKMTGYSNASLPRSKDMVRVDARQESSGQWRADSISKLQGIRLPQAPSQPGPSLMDALKSPQGQTVIKRGLTGALVGGVASGASGGKAGKGALIGAGAGIVGGWLSDVLSGPSRQSQSNAPTVAVQSDNSR